MSILWISTYQKYCTQRITDINVSVFVETDNCWWLDNNGGERWMFLKWKSGRGPRVRSKRKGWPSPWIPLEIKDLFILSRLLTGLPSPPPPFPSPGSGTDFVLFIHMKNFSSVPEGLALDNIVWSQIGHQEEVTVLEQNPTNFRY